MSLHVYTTSTQPATAWVDNCGLEPIHGGWKPDEMLCPDCCNTTRPASDCVVQCYYDGLQVWCAPLKGCKDTQVIAAKKHKEFNNRSEAQKARWIKNRSEAK